MITNSLIVLDIDGTLTDSVNIHQGAFKSALHDFGFVDYNSDFGSYLHHTDSHIFSEIFKSQRGVEASDKDILDFEEVLFHKTIDALQGAAIKEIHGANKFIQSLQQCGYDIVYATGSFSKPAKLKLKHIGLTVDEELLISSNGIYSREDLVRQAVVNAQRFYEKDYTKVISLGDGLWDLKTAQALDIDFVGIGNKKLYEMGASKVFINFTEPDIHHHFNISTDETLLPDFKINPGGKISDEFLKRKINSFKEAAEWIKILPYGRNNNKDDLSTLFSDNCGTCSTKHALLKELCNENYFQGTELVIGLFKMNGTNTPDVSETLLKNNLEFIPEAHNYLKYCGKILDYTKPTFDPADFVDDLIEEVVITPDQISSHKVAYHKNYLKNWLNANPQIKMTEAELWAIREACIRDLS